MKMFHITLRDGRYGCVEAESYRREGEQYVFDGTASGEVEFFTADEVIGITVAEPASSRPGGGFG